MRAERETGGRHTLLARAVQKLPVAIDELAVRIDLAAGAEVADQVPVERRAVEAARLWIRGSEREVHRPADLLVEERVAREHRHGLVHAERELPHAPGPVVHRDHLPQELLAAGRRGLDHLAGFEAKPHVVDLARVEDPGIREPDLAFDAGLDWSREDLSVGEVLLTLGGNPGPALCVEPQIGSVGDDSKLPLRREKPGKAVEPLAELLP